MIHLCDGRFSLRYDLLSDRGSLWFDNDLLIAESADAGWNVIHGPGWFEVEHRHSRDGVRVFGGRDLRSRLRHIRAIAGLSNDIFSRLHRMGEMNDLRKWDALMKHGIWKCNRPECGTCR